MVVITGYYANLTRSVKLIPWPGRPKSYLWQPVISKTETMARGTEVPFAATSDHLPSHPTKDGRATDSCFALIAAHPCGVLMINAG